MTLLNNLRKTLDAVRAIPGFLSLRNHEVSVVIKNWTKLGESSPSITIIPLKHNNQNPNVKQISSKDVIASNGLFATTDLELTLTPTFSFVDGYGGYDSNTFDPVRSNQEIYFLINGPSYQNAYFKKISQDTTNQLTTKIFLTKCPIQAL